MKKIIRLVLASLLSAAAFAQNSADTAGVSAQLAPDGGSIVVEARGVKPKAPLFFSATAQNDIRVGASELAGEIKLAIHIVQGRPEVLTLGLEGNGEVVEVTGDGLRDWAVRQSGGKRFLDLRPTLEEGRPVPTDLALTIHTRVAKPAIPGALTLPLLTPGDAVGFASQISLTPDESVDLRVTKADGLTPFGNDSAPHATQRFSTTGEATLEIALVQRGSATADAELAGARLAGKLDDAAGCVNFVLTGEARVRVAGARLTLLSGAAALDNAATGDGWHVEWKDGQTDLVFDKTGNFPVQLAFSAVLHKENDWKWLNFSMPAGTVVPMTLEG
ncbi:MAG: hypothetical protein ACREKL_07450, partial [Chthoniobacterales bacterium]